MEPGLRIDKWLWAARFFKTRALSQDAVENGRVLVGGDRVKPARTLRIGDLVHVRVGDLARTVVVRELSDRRGPAPQAQLLYEALERHADLGGQPQHLLDVGRRCPAPDLQHGSPAVVVVRADALTRTRAGTGTCPSRARS